MVSMAAHRSSCDWVSPNTHSSLATICFLVLRRIDWMQSCCSCVWTFAQALRLSRKWCSDGLSEKVGFRKNLHTCTRQCSRLVRSVSIAMLAIIMILISYFLRKHCVWVNLWCIICIFPGYSKYCQSFEYCKQCLRSRFSSSSCTIFLQATALFSS